MAVHVVTVFDWKSFLEGIRNNILFHSIPYNFRLELAPGSTRCMTRYQLHYENEQSWLPRLPTSVNVTLQHCRFQPLDLVGGTQELYDHFWLNEDAQASAVASEKSLSKRKRYEAIATTLGCLNVLEKQSIVDIFRRMELGEIEIAAASKDIFKQVSSFYDNVNNAFEGYLFWIKKNSDAVKLFQNERPAPVHYYPELCAAVSDNQLYKALVTTPKEDIARRLYDDKEHFPNVKGWLQESESKVEKAVILHEDPATTAVEMIELVSEDDERVDEDDTKAIDRQRQRNSLEHVAAVILQSKNAKKKKKSQPKSVGMNGFVASVKTTMVAGSLLLLEWFSKHAINYDRSIDGMFYEIMKFFISYLIIEMFLMNL